MEGRIVSCTLLLAAVSGACAEQIFDDPEGECTPSGCALRCLEAGYSYGDCGGGVCTCLGSPPSDAGTDAGAETDAASDDGGGTETDAAVDDDGDAGTDLDDAGRTDSGYCAPELGGSCNLVTQCGCGAGERCILGDMGETCTRAGTDPVDALCGGADNCVAQNQCLAFLDDREKCMQFCYTDGDCPAGRSCLLPLAPEVGYMVCADPPDACDPFTGSGCAAGEGCLVFPGSPGANYCAPAGTVGPGGDCSYSECRVGSACYMTDPSGTPQCWKYCDLRDGDPGCADVPGASCEDALGASPVGVCWAG